MKLQRVFLTYAAAVAAALFLFVGTSRAAEEPEPGAAPAGEQAANGLEIKLVMKDRSFTFRENTVTRKVLILELKNVGDKPLVLGFSLSGGFFGGLPADSPLKFTGKDAAGKEAAQEPVRGGQAEVKPEDKPVLLTILKPGKTLEQEVGGALRFTADGKYTVCAELEEKERDEILPGVKTWVGKIKSNSLEYDYRRRGGPGNRPGGGNRPAGGNRPGGGQQQNPAPPAGGEKEAF